MPVTTIRALPAPTGAPRDQPATLPTCGAVPINAAVTPVVNVSGGARPHRNRCPGPPERVVGCSGISGRVVPVSTSGRVTSEPVPGVRPEYALRATGELPL
jgi:hypothetical protein